MMNNNCYDFRKPTSENMVHIENEQERLQEKDIDRTSSDSNKKTSVRGISESIFIEMKRIFPQAKSNAALMEAVAYIFTNGKCKISPRAMELVKSYNSDSNINILSEQITYLTSAVHDLDKKMSNYFNDKT